MNKESFLGSSRGVIIYGAGVSGRRVHALLKKCGVKVNCFLDKKGGDNAFIEDIPVFKPDYPSVDKNVKVIVALFNHETNIVPVLFFLRKRGFVDVIPYTEFFIHFADEFPIQYWLGPTDIYELQAQDIADALELFQDKTSRNLFKAFLKFRVSGDPHSMPQPDIKNIYFPPRIHGVRKPDNFIDCGAFNGDTLLAIKEKFGILTSIRAFEPDLENFRKLTDLQASRKHFSKDTVLIPCAVWSSTECLRFISDGSLSSSVSERGDSIVQGVSLDECLDGYVPTLIKMDIEGGEIEALRGGQKMIASMKPDLAISVYHAPDHLWKIPLFISKLNPKYKFYLRSHGYSGYDTVLYAYDM